jgi:hypothetical protein
MFHEVDIDFWTRIAGATWVILVGLVTLLLSLLALLLPLFVWRILHWSRMSAQELAHLNARMEHLLTSLASERGTGGEGGEFIFTKPQEPERREGREKNFPRRARSARRRSVISSFPSRPTRS